MAKCVGSVNHWTPNPIQLDSIEFLEQTPRQVEAAIKQRIEQVASGPLLEIATDFIKVKQAALSEDEFVLDSRQIQDGLVDKLKDLINHTATTVKSISGRDGLSASTKHGYFIQYTYGVVEKLQQLCQTVGRLSEIDQKLFMEEQRKLLISDESIAIHTLTSIWTAILEILNEFCRQAKTVFSQSQADELEEGGQTDNFLDELEFSTTRNLVIKIILMDLIISSWIKFNRLVKYEDLAKSIPFLCPCHMKAFFKILGDIAEASPKGRDEPSDHILSDLLSSILDHESKTSMMTLSVRRPGVIPMNPCYSNAERGQLGYFIIWHLYALSSRVRGPTSQRQLDNTRTLMDKSLLLVRKSFICDPNISRLSSHQEERYKLLFHMISVWCERNPGHHHNAILLDHLLEFADLVDSLPRLETRYFNNSDFNINDSTLFQLCAKLINDTKSYTADGQPQAVDQSSLTADQKRLVATWNALIEKHVSGEAPVSNPIALS